MEGRRQVHSVHLAKVPLHHLQDLETAPFAGHNKLPVDPLLLVRGLRSGCPRFICGAGEARVPRESAHGHEGRGEDLHLEVARPSSAEHLCHRIQKSPHLFDHTVCSVLLVLAELCEGPKQIRGLIGLAAPELRGGDGRQLGKERRREDPELGAKPGLRG